MRLGGLRGIGAETSPFIPAGCFSITSEHILIQEQPPHCSSRFCQSQTGISVRTPAQPGKQLPYLCMSLQWVYLPLFAMGVPTTQQPRRQLLS